jgi:WD40 repeat protein
LYHCFFFSLLFFAAVTNMFTQLPNAHTEVVTSLVFSPHVATCSESGGLLCSTSGDDTAALWDLRAGSNGATQRVAHLTGHHVGPVNHALFHPVDTNVILTASDDRSIACWDLRRPDRVVGKISGFQEGVNKVLWLPASSVGCGGGAELGSGWSVVSACDDGHVYVHAFVLPGGNNNNSHGTGDTNPSAPTASATGAMAATGTTPVPQMGALVDKFRVSTSTVNDIVLAPNSTTVLITASEDCALRSWSLRRSAQLNTTVGMMEERLLASLDEFENPVNHVVVVPPGLMGAGNSSAVDGVAQQSSLAGAGEVNQGSGSTAFARRGEDNNDDDEENGIGGAGGVDPYQRSSADISEATGTGCWLLAACSECVFGVDFALRSGQFGSGARAFVGHRDYVRGLEFTNNGTLLTVSDDSTAMEWDLSSTDPIRQVKLHEGMVMSSALSPSRTLLATGTDGGEIRVWRLPFETERMGGH